MGKNNTINLSKDELFMICNTNKDILLDLCMRALKKYIKNKSYYDENDINIYIEDEIGNENKVSTSGDIYKFEPEDAKLEIKRNATIKFRKQLSENIDNASIEIHHFNIEYRRNRNIIGKNEVNYCLDGKTVSCASFFYDDSINPRKEGFYQKSYEGMSIQGYVERKLVDEYINKDSSISHNIKESFK